MANNFFQFKQFKVLQAASAMKVTTDSCLFGAWVAAILSNEKKPSRLLDIGTGTGLLALMVAQKCPDIRIDSVEINAESAAEAITNVAASPWNERIVVYHDDIKEFQVTTPYDLIISNPPFYESDLVSGNPSKDTAHHSDQLNLTGLFKSIDRLLSKDGRFFILLPFKRNDEVMKVITSHRFTTTGKMLVRPSVNHAPARIMIECSRLPNAGEPEKIEIDIRKSDDEYTEEFVKLLADYYLYL